ncbi:MAG: hormogonium polysaccharide biosynthesis glycosyltransferase HpsE [Xenococcaceae cyanobacterium MO_188.B32]|nr:hormogonium polysaccharide biosynthesis glycosyltransferase HpsE [Xenococcaceae cyanobacterium MO_188.B32]
MNNIDFSIAIPTYNGEERLPKVLERLKQQICTVYFTWEVIVIDNNSDDKTVEVVQSYQANWVNTSSLRYCFEEKQGLAFARQRAIKEARGELIAFIDDDILPSLNWLTEAYYFANNHPQAGAYGGQIHGDFEVKPPDNFERIESFLAIREKGEEAHLYQPDILSLPPGAALVVRKQAWCENVPDNPVLIGRVNEVMLAGEDYETLLHMHHSGWEIWYNPTMHVYHQIPQKRLEKEYLISLIRGCSLCICYLRLLKAKSWQKPIIMAKIMLGSFKRAISHIIKYQWQIKTDLVAACEMEFFVSSFLSPLYFLRHTVRSNLRTSLNK